MTAMYPEPCTGRGASESCECQQAGTAAAEFRGAWHSDGLPDAAALVFSTFELLFPDTFQRILPVHKHKVPCPCTPPRKAVNMQSRSRAGLGWRCHATDVWRQALLDACAVSACWRTSSLGRLSMQVKCA